MDGTPSSPERRRLTIPRKAVGANTNTLPTTSRLYNRDDNVNTDGVSVNGRSSFEDEMERMLNPSSSPDNGDHGYDIGEQNIPLVDLNDEIARRVEVQEADESGEHREDQDPGPANIPESSCTWIPRTLRWPYMIALFVISLGLSFLVLGLTLHSQRRNGLGADQDTPIFLFGWRFTPTLVAVIYSLILMAMVDDIKRTEPYARLSRTEGGTAESTIFLKTGFFLFDPIMALRRQHNNGKRNWALLWASTANIIAILVISPFSAALLSPADAVISRDTTFSRLDISAQSPLKLSTVDDSIFFRTISTVLLNTTTSAWVNNNFTILPFWPSQQKSVPLGAVLSGSNEHWIAKTTVYQAELQCQVMDLQNVANLTSNYTYDEQGGGEGTLPQNWTSFVLKSSDGCSFGSAIGIDAYSQDTGRGLWSRIPDFSYPELGNNVVDGKLLDFGSRPVMLNSSTECSNRSLFYYAAPFEFDKTFVAQGYVCNTEYYSAEIEVTVNNSVAMSTVSFDTEAFHQTKIPLGPSMMDIPLFEETFLTQNWSSKFREPSYSTRPLAKIGGPLILLAAQNRYDLRAMVGNPNIYDQAREVKQRFFGESVQPVFSRASAQKAEIVSGKTEIIRRSIVVNFSVGIILVVSFLLATVMIVLATFFTRSRQRPLNLSRDPGTVMGVTSLLCAESATRAVFDGLDRLSEPAMIQHLANHLFYLRNGNLYAYPVGTQEQTEPEKPPKQNSDWRPAVIRGWLLSMLLTILVALLATLAVLFSMYRKTGIYQQFLVKDLTLRFGSKAIENLAPYSIIPTLVAVGVKLWWESIDQAFRRLQPYISMTRGPSRNSVGVDSSYNTTPVGWAAVQAAKHKQWLLALVTFGALLVQIFTVSMSALWDRNSGIQSSESIFHRYQELRTVPAVFIYGVGDVGRAGGSGTSVTDKTSNAALSHILGDMLTSWLYAGIVEGSSNASARPWTDEDWVFAPINLTSPSDAASSPILRNATLNTAALRARLECSPVDMSNHSEWLFTHDFTNKTLWNDTKLLPGMKVGYELKSSFRNQFSDSVSLSFSPGGNRLVCCSNQSGESVGQSAIGYWTQPLLGLSKNIYTTWITGYPLEYQFKKSDQPSYDEGRSHWIWRDIPTVTAVNCTPIFESTNASVKVNLLSGIVQSHEILNEPVIDPNAFKWEYADLNLSAGLPWSSSNTGHGAGYLKEGGMSGDYQLNMTSSYGFLFHDALLHSSNLNPTPYGYSLDDEDLEDRNFNFRLPGLNVDFMSYTALNLVGNAAETLHVSDKLANVSSTVFSIFFKHFVQAGSDDRRDELYMNGSWGLQPLGAAPPSDLGPLMSTTTYLQNISVPSNASATAISSIVNTQIEQLDLSPAAVILTIVILFLLFLITIIVVGWHRQHLRLLPRDVDSLGSVLGFVYASEKLLALTRQQNETRIIGEGDGEMAVMGWFESGGKRRWGIEIADSVRSNDEESMASRKQGSYVMVELNEATRPEN